jgi:hypothetical protein
LTIIKLNTATQRFHLIWSFFLFCLSGETYKTVVNIAEYGQVKTVDIFLVFVTEKSTPADMKFPVVAKGNGKYELDKLKMLDRVRSSF